MFVPPVQRGHRRLREAGRHGLLRRSGRNVDSVGTVLFWIHHDQLAVSGGNRVNGPAAIHCRVVLVGGSFIVHEGVVITNVPQSDDHIPLNTFRPLGRRRNFAFRDAIGPVGENFQRGIMTHRAQCPVHGVASNAAMQTAIPGIE